MLKHFTADRFQLQQNRFCRSRNRSGIPNCFLPRNVATFHSRSISAEPKSFLVLLKSIFRGIPPGGYPLKDFLEPGSSDPAISDTFCARSEKVKPAGLADKRLRKQHRQKFVG